MKTLSILLFFLFSTQISGEIFSQKAETLFQRALAHYNQDNFSDARDGFIELVEQHPPNQRTSAARFMLAKSHYKLKAYDLALNEAIALQHHYPRSRYISETDLIIGDCYFHQRQIYNAATQYARVLTSRADIRTKARAADRLSQLSDGEKLTDSEIDNLKIDFNRAIIDEAIAFGKVRWHIKLGNLETGNKYLSFFLDHHPNGQFTALAHQIPIPERTSPQPTPKPQKARYKIGVIAPLGTPSGEDLRNGITLARDRNPLTSHDQIELIFEDSEGDPIRAARAAQRLVEEREVLAIIGALTSAVTTPIATMLSAQKVPLIAPTASDDGIASLSPYVFQVNATPGAQGRHIAEHAVNNQSLRTLASLASRDDYGRSIARAFATRAEDLGAEVLIQEWYEPGTTDYRRQFERIRIAGLALQAPDDLASEIDSLILGNIRVAPPPPVVVDPDTVQLEVVEALDGILIAGGAEDILLIAPQFHSALVSSQVLGSDGWNHDEVARDGGNYVDGAIFVAKYYDQSHLESVQNFVNAYRSRYGKEQNIVAALGHDAMLSILHGINAGGTTRDRLRDRLETLADIPGATGQISFDKGHRENAWMYMLTIRNRRIELYKNPQMDADGHR
ncbi:MAG: ABC transporter substrate-binding protein [Gemmatimonadota bacterium]|nr:ABC transporter substrate-binding protein [Gemmatimonadota bacterium]